MNRKKMVQILKKELCVEQDDAKKRLQLFASAHNKDTLIVTEQLAFNVICLQKKNGKRSQ